MALPQDRYEIHHPDPSNGLQVIATAARRNAALLIARDRAHAHGHDLMVCDRMAHHGQTRWRRVSPTGQVTPQ